MFTVPIRECIDEFYRKSGVFTSYMGEFMAIDDIQETNNGIWIWFGDYSKRASEDERVYIQENRFDFE